MIKLHFFYHSSEADSKRSIARTWHECLVNSVLNSRKKLKICGTSSNSKILRITFEFSRFSRKDSLEKKRKFDQSKDCLNVCLTFIDIFQLLDTTFIPIWKFLFLCVCVCMCVWEKKKKILNLAEISRYFADFLWVLSPIILLLSSN